MENLYKPVSLFLKLTDFCPNNCLDGRYCFTGCRPDSNVWIDRRKLDDIFLQAKQVGIRELAYVSTEPFTDIDFLVDVTSRASTSGIVPRFLVTNARFASSYEIALDYYRRIKDSGFNIDFPDDYIGTGYNGIDISVDQFHNVVPEFASNAILGALDVFGQSNYVSIRTTDPSEKYRNPSVLNSVVRLLQNSGRVKGLSPETREIVFVNGSRVIVHRQSAEKFGNAKALPDDFYNWRKLGLDELVCYKDLNESLGEIVLPYHKLYLDPNGQVFPEFGRFSVLSGGNVNEISVAEAIQNINDNPLTALFMFDGLKGVVEIANQEFGIPINTYGTGLLNVADRYLSDTKLMDKIKFYLRKSGLEERIRNALGPLFLTFRQGFENRSIRIEH